MQETPFFSIVMPTKNRANIVGYAIEALLNQTYRNFELIITDNDDSNATNSLIAKYTDPRIKYLRTGQLGMIQNWNAGLDQTQGEYVLVVGDKIVFYPDSLEILHKEVLNTKAQVLCYLGDTYDDTDDHHHYVVRKQTDNKVYKKLSENILKDLKSSLYIENPESHYWIPAPNKAVTKRSLMQKIKELTGGYSFGGSPDYNNGLIKLFLMDEISLLNKSIYLTSTVKTSAGAQCSFDKEFTAKLRKSYNEKQDFCFEYVPMKFHCSSNFLINEIMRCQEIVTGNKNFDVDTVEYFVAIYADINNRYAQEKGVVYEEENFIWTRAFNELPSEVKKQIQRKIEELQHIRVNSQIKNLKALVKKIPFLYKLAKAIVKSENNRVVSGNFKNPIEYIHQEYEG